VDISAHLDRKLAALRCHDSRVNGSAMVDPEVVAASARHFGALARVRYAEAFAPARFVWDLAAVPQLPVPEHLPAAAPTARVPAW
jgi:LmbE family N-acetylglucosaminyl deacetylase